MSQKNKGCKYKYPGSLVCNIATALSILDTGKQTIKNWLDKCLKRIRAVSILIVKCVIL